jgi:hypothetical protein
MSAAGKTPVAPAVPLPCCPHCGAELPGLGLFNWNAGSWMILAVYCSSSICRKILNMQVLPMVEEQRVIPPN